MSTQREGWLIYGELIEKREEDEIHLKMEEELPYKYNWLEYLQIKNLFKKDKKEKGLRLMLWDTEQIMLETDKKLITKLYKKLLEWFLAAEYVKEYMTKWSVNFNRTIEMER